MVEHAEPSVRDLRTSREAGRFLLSAEADSYVKDLVPDVLMLNKKQGRPGP